MGTFDSLAKQGIYYRPLDGAEQKPAEEEGDVKRGFKKALYQIPQTAGGAAALVGDIVGSDGLRDYGMGVYQKNADKIDAITKPSDSLSNVLEGDGDAVDWLQNAAGYTGGQALTALATGGVGGLIGKQLAARGISAMVGRQVAAKVAERAAEREVADTLAQRAAGQLVAPAVAAAGRRGAVAGTGTALGGSNLVQEAGSIYPDAVEQAQKDGRELTDADKWRVAGAAAAAAGVDTGMDMLMAGRVLHGARRAGEGIGRAALREIPGAMGREAVTEGIQTGIERFGAQQDLTTADAIRDYVDSAGVGAVGGGMGGAASIIRSQKVQEVGPLSRAANAGIEQQVLQLQHDPQPLISFPDGSVGHKQDLEAYLSQFTDPEERTRKRREVMGRDPETGKRPKPEPVEEPKFVSNEDAEAQNMKAWGARHDGVPLDYAQALVGAPGAKGLGLMIVPHPKGRDYTVVPSKWLTLDSQAKYAAIQKGDAGKLPAPDREAPGGAIRVDSEGGAAPETYAEQARTAQGQREAAAAADAAAAQRVELGQPIPAGAAPAPELVLNPKGEPFKSKFAAQRRMDMDGLKDSHRIAEVPGGWVLQANPAPAAMPAPAAVENPAAAAQEPAVAAPAPAEATAQPESADVVQANPEAGSGEQSADVANAEPGATVATGEPGIAGAVSDVDAAAGAPALTEQNREATPAEAQAQQIDTAAHEAATSPNNDLPEPTQAQKEAGNYKKGHVQVHGLNVTIENPAGSTRSGVAPDGRAWENKLANHYGYIKSTEGADGDHVDAFIGPNPASGKVFVVDQTDPATGQFDEHKIVLGADSAEQASEIYHANYEKGWKGGKAIHETDVAGFKGWLASGDTKAPYVAGVGESGATVAESGAAPAAPEPLKFRDVQYRRKADGWEVSRDGERWGAVRSKQARETLDRGEDPNPNDERVSRAAPFKVGEEVHFSSGIYSNEKPGKGAHGVVESISPTGRIVVRAPSGAGFGVRPDEYGTLTVGPLPEQVEQAAAPVPEPKAKRQPNGSDSAKAKELFAKPAKPKAPALQARDKKIAEKAAESDPLAAFDATVKDMNTGELSLADYKAAHQHLLDNEEGIKAALGEKKKDDLLAIGGPNFAYRYKAEKKDRIIKSLFDNMLMEFAISTGGMFSYGMDGPRPAIQKIVDGMTGERLQSHADSIRQARAEREQAKVERSAGMADPKTLEDYTAIIRAKQADGMNFMQARLSLPESQRAALDELMGEKARADRAARKTEKLEQSMRAPGEALTASETIQTRHTKHGHDLWQFSLDQRVTPEEFKDLVAKAKRLGGDYSSYRGNGAIPGWQFRTPEAAAAFKQLIAGDTSAANEVAQARRDAFADDRSQSAAERLTEMADRLEDQADESDGRERKSNTARRARFAAAAEAQSARQRAMAQTMRRIVDSMASGKAKFLDRVRQKVQIELLEQLAHNAKDAAQRANPDFDKQTYDQREAARQSAPTVADMDHAEWPAYTAYRSDLANLGRQLLEIDGTKKLGQQILKVADDVSDSYIKFAKANIDRVATFTNGAGRRASFANKEAAEEAIARSGYHGKAIVLAVKRGENLTVMSPSEAKTRGVWPGDDDEKITLSPEVGAEIVDKLGRINRNMSRVRVPWQFETTHQRRAVLARMNIETPAEMRAALREYLGMKVAPKEVDRVKELERSMTGRRKDGLDFFPTPAGQADEMIAAAEIVEGMRVLEPSAGMGHIADQIRTAGVEADVVEMSGERRELLEAKGYNLVGSDFMELTDPEGYDRIVMNPPFSDRRDAEHVQHAYSLLKPGGRLVAIMGEGVFFGQDKKAEAFRNWLEARDGTSEKLAEGTFMDPSLPVNTSVNARMVVIDKPAGDLRASTYYADKTIEVDGERKPIVDSEGNLIAPDFMGQLEFWRNFNGEIDEKGRPILDDDMRASLGMGTAEVDGKIADLVRDGASIHSVLQAIEAQSKNADFRQLAAALRAQNLKTGIVYGRPSGGAYIGGVSESYAAASYREATDIAYLHQQEGAAQLLLHELTHAATLKALNKGGLAAQQIKALYNHVKNRSLFKDQYGTVNEAEFVAEAYTNPDFRRLLANTPAPDVKMSSWDKFVGIVRRILGLPVTKDNVLARVMAAQGDLFAENRDGQTAQGGKDSDLRASTAGARISQAMANGINSATITELPSKVGNRLKDFRNIGLQALGRRQIVDIYAGDFKPSAGDSLLTRYSKMMQQMDADKNEAGAEADGIADRWGKLKDGDKLADLMHDSTLAQIDPSKDYVAGDNRAEWASLKNRLGALTPEAKTIYDEARDAYNAHWQKVRSEIRSRITRSLPDSAQRAAMLEKMDATFYEKVKGVYFPLARFGDYVVTVQNAAGERLSVNFAETNNEAAALRKALLAKFPPSSGAIVSKVTKKKEFNAGRDSVSRGFMSQLHGLLDQYEESAELRDDLNQLYLQSMPDLSWAKHGIHRKGTPGFSQDARRAFAQNMFHGARYLAKLRYADQLGDLLTDMQDHVDSKAADAAYDSVQAQQVVDEMNKRHNAYMSPNTNPLSSTLTSLGFIFYLGLSPASAAVNLSQTPLVTLPMLAAKHGFAKASAALLQASKEAAANRNDISKVLQGDELRAFNEAVNAGVIDVSMAHDLAGIASGSDTAARGKLRPIMKWASWMFHHGEKFNRQATLLAAYRLAREAGQNHEQAYETAVKDTYDSHFDYSAGNRPRIMQGDVARVVFLFKQYSQNMIYTLSRNAQLAARGDREALKTFAGLLLSHSMAAGVLGLPVVGTLLSIATALGGDDDDPWDAKIALRNLIADLIGKKPAEVMMHGLSRLTPFDISGRVGLDKLILPDIQEGLEGSRAFESWMTAALGPVAGIGLSTAKGLQDLAHGQVLRGLEGMMPVAVRNPLKALRLNQEGVRDKSGIPVLDDTSAMEEIGQLIGFSPSRSREAMEGKGAVYQAEHKLNNRRQALVEQWAHARMAGDNEGATEISADIQKFNEKNPARMIKQAQLQASLRNRNKHIREAQDGLYLPKKHRDVRDLGRFAKDD